MFLLINSKKLRFSQRFMENSFRNLKKSPRENCPFHSWNFFFKKEICFHDRCEQKARISY